MIFLSSNRGTRGILAAAKCLKQTDIQPMTVKTSAVKKSILSISDVPEKYIKAETSDLKVTVKTGIELRGELTAGNHYVQ
ncbi:MAG: hypothetical protein LBT89_02930 [Planctomycetaceae bacterium]|jgi:hypothetical protein|nr:hypothetical protein [Planctomycetaceae bacterium]